MSSISADTAKKKRSLIMTYHLGHGKFLVQTDFISKINTTCYCRLQQQISSHQKTRGPVSRQPNQFGKINIC